MKSKKDPEISRFFKCPKKRYKAYYESVVDAWVYPLNSTVWDIVPKHEVIDAWKGLNAYYGYFWDDWDVLEKKPEKKIEDDTSKPCAAPHMHYFEEKIFLHCRRQVCKHCGYCPDFGQTKGFEQCHEEYIKWKKD